jgi:phosphoglycolate phosphatase-like HAD superfamily hydrolase
MIRLFPRDQLAPAGDDVALEVEVETVLAPFADPPAPGVHVEVQGFPPAVSGDDGVAVLPLGRLPPGTHRLLARAAGRSAEALVRVVPREARVLLTDVDGTIADCSAAGFIVRPMRSIRPLPGSAEALTALSSSMEIVYLTARDHVFRAKTLEWLRLNRFPEAPVYLRRGTRFWSCPSRRHKVLRVGELKERFPNFAAGIGDLRGDLLAYAAHGIPAIQIGPRALPGLPEGAVWAKDWEEIRRRLSPPGIP